MGLGRERKERMEWGGKEGRRERGKIKKTSEEEELHVGFNICDEA